MIRSCTVFFGVVVVVVIMLKNYPSICLNGLRTPLKHLGHNYYLGGLNSNPGPPKYNEGVLITEV